MENRNDTFSGVGEGNDAIQGAEGNDSKAACIGNTQDMTVANANGVLMKSGLQKPFELTDEGRQKIDFICRKLQDWELPRIN